LFFTWQLRSPPGRLKESFNSRGSPRPV
jgi:hypothetical protein